MCVCVCVCVCPHLNKKGTQAICIKADSLHG